MFQNLSFIKILHSRINLADFVQIVTKNEPSKTTASALRGNCSRSCKAPSVRFSPFI